jgi:hypothetical protein
MAKSVEYKWGMMWLLPFLVHKQSVTHISWNAIYWNSFRL